MDDLKTRGWLFPPHDGLPMHALWTTRDYSAVHWAALVPSDPLGYAAASLVCSVFAMLKDLDIESRSGLVVEVNHELALTGLANLLCGALGGLTANHASSYISVLRNARISSRRVPALSALLRVLLTHERMHMLAPTAWSERSRVPALLTLLADLFCLVAGLAILVTQDRFALPPLATSDWHGLLLAVILTLDAHLLLAAARAQFEHAPEQVRVTVRL